MFRRMGMTGAVALLSMMGLLFTALNPQRVDVDLGVTRVGVSAGLAVLIAFSAGVILGAAWRSNWIARLLAERGRLRNPLRLAEARRLADAPRAAVPPPAAHPRMSPDDGTTFWLTLAGTLAAGWGPTVADDV